jgi:hypothetical protein
VASKLRRNKKIYKSSCFACSKNPHTSILEKKMQVIVATIYLVVGRKKISKEDRIRRWWLAPARLVVAVSTRCVAVVTGEYASTPLLPQDAASVAINASPSA